MSEDITPCPICLRLVTDLVLCDHRVPPAQGMIDQATALLKGKEHELKCWPEFFEEVASGRKTFEIRQNDRAFAVGDVLRLCEFRPQWGTYTGRQVLKRVTYITDFHQQAGFVVMGLEDAAAPQLVRDLLAENARLARELQEERDEIRPTATELTHLEVERVWREQLAAAEAELVRLRSSGGHRAEWQGIESAPKDGTPFLMWAAGSRVTEGFWDDVKLFFRSSYRSDLFAFRPTHWAPMPDPPALHGDSETTTEAEWFCKQSAAESSLASLSAQLETLEHEMRALCGAPTSGHAGASTVIAWADTLASLRSQITN